VRQGFQRSQEVFGIPGQRLPIPHSPKKLGVLVKRNWNVPKCAKKNKRKEPAYKRQEDTQAWNNVGFVNGKRKKSKGYCI
jgi:hypothetical protein